MLNFGNKEFRNLQEQVLKNAQDIELLKDRGNLQVVIVEELPEVGNPNYIYLVPNDGEEEANVYNEYIWLIDEEAYEQIGGVNIDLTNYVTLDTDQTITGVKSLPQQTQLKFECGSTPSQYKMAISSDSSYGLVIGRYTSYGATLQGGVVVTKDNLKPTSTNAMDLGASGTTWKDLYLSGIIYHSNYYVSWDNGIIFKNSSNTTLFYIGSNGQFWIYGDVIPAGTSGTKDLGNTTHFWKDVYLTGSLKDGLNTVSVANIASKETSIYASGTFDSNGESTIDISGGEPEGLFIFTAGNCQTFMRLTATMVQNADLAPIAVPCPFVSGGTPVTSTLKITRSGTTLTLLLGTSGLHVSADVAWTLVKTNLI